MLIVGRALRGADELPIAERADLYEAAAEVLTAKHPEEASAAAIVAQALREANARQLIFTSLFQASRTA